MSKHWKPRKPTVALRPSQRPSRIRREPVRLEQRELDPVKAEANAREREMWGGVAGVLLFAGGLAVLVIGISAATIFHDDRAAAARAARFGQCYNSGPNCVVDGDTIRVAGRTVAIAGVEAPQIQGARCADERAQGIEAAVRLADLLNSGRVTIGAPFSDPYGRAVRKVRVGGEDVAATLIDAGVAREYGGSSPGWCG